MADVLNCLDSPDFTQTALCDSMHSWKQTGDLYLRITWIHEAGNRVVISATTKRNPPTE